MPLPDILNIGFHADEPKLWATDIPVKEIAISEIDYNLDIPYLEQEGTEDWNLTPRMLIENFDKEFIRLWYTTRIDPYKDKIPPMPQDLIISASKRYIEIYETITGKKFEHDFSQPIMERLTKNLENLPAQAGI